jgi:SET domain-containing protein
MKIYPSIKIYLSDSPVHGVGVFASQKISEGEIFEICPVIDMKLPKNVGVDTLMDYRFNWPQGQTDWEKQVVAVGFGMLYNHSNNANASWRSNFELNSFEFYALREILPNEEIFIYYGGESYWNDGRNHVNVI